MVSWYSRWRGESSADRGYATVITNSGEVVGVHTQRERWRLVCEVIASSTLRVAGGIGVHGMCRPSTSSTYR